MELEGAGFCWTGKTENPEKNPGRGKENKQKNSNYL